jgi:hypothetical protein
MLEKETHVNQQKILFPVKTTPIVIGEIFCFLE